MRRKALQKKMAFTLIELLIVVAIIAILALIAVPNFLEAQVRAKVSRIKGDMRTLATAIEAYMVDYNEYPPDPYDPGFHQPGWADVLNILTSPIAYITSLPKDPFADENVIYDDKIWYFTKSGYYMNRHPSERSQPTGFFFPPRDTFMWAMDSPGPDLWWEFDRYPGGYISAKSGLPYAGDTLYYDPTNGSVSQGDIMYFGPGGGINPAPQPVHR